MPQQPVVIGMELCEQVIVEEGTRNVTLVNCFSRKNLGRFPSPAVPFFVHAALADGLGEMTMEEAVERLDTLEEVFRQSYQVRFEDRLKLVRFIARVTRCAFPAAGTYEVSLHCNREVLAQRKFRVQ